MLSRSIVILCTVCAIAPSCSDRVALETAQSSATVVQLEEPTEAPEHTAVTDRDYAAGGELATERQKHFAVPLADGRVFVVGGEVLSRSANTSGINAFPAGTSLIWDPRAKTWGDASNLPLDLVDIRSATRLHDGRVLLLARHPRAYFWLPTVNIFVPAPNPKGLHRDGHTATLLTDGRVLLLGGQITDKGEEAEIWDPTTNQWTFVPSPSISHRWKHSATRLQDGTVLVAGGHLGLFSSRLAPPRTRATAETFVFDPSQFDSQTQTWLPTAWKPVGSLNTGRAGHQAVALADGRVMVLGGKAQIANAAHDTPTTEIWDPATGQWTPGPEYPGELQGAALTRLASGHVLVTGGSAVGVPQASVHIWHPAWFNRDRPIGWKPLDDLPQPRGWHTASLLLDGRVLIAGGTRPHRSEGPGVVGQAILWQPKPGTTDNAMRDLPTDGCDLTIQDASGQQNPIVLAEGDRCLLKSCGGIPVCSAGACICESCNDGFHNGQETDTDCGGPRCSPCELEDICKSPRDCRSSYCDGTCKNPVRIAAIDAPTDPLVERQVARLQIECENLTDRPQACPIHVEDIQFGQVHGGLNWADDFRETVPAQSKRTYRVNVTINGIGARQLRVRISHNNNSYVIDEAIVPIQVEAKECRNRKHDANESFVDCGGPSTCRRCLDQHRCTQGADCVSQYCQIAVGETEGVCIPKPDNTCNDGIRNFGESATDCGSVCGIGCIVGQTCTKPEDCQSGHCEAGQCWTNSSCTDDDTNGLETDLNCGGPDIPGLGCPRCTVGASCKNHTDCDSGFCNAAGTCEAPTTAACLADESCSKLDRCSDGEPNTLETDTDCGGPLCGPCLADATCKAPTDCVTGICSDGRCQAGPITEKDLLASAAMRRHQRFILDLFEAALPGQTFATISDLSTLSAQDKATVQSVYSNAKGGILRRSDTKTVDTSNAASSSLFSYVEYTDPTTGEVRYETVTDAQTQLADVTAGPSGGRIFLRDLAGGQPPTTITKEPTDIVLADYPAPNPPDSPLCNIDHSDTSMVGIVSNISCYYNRYKTEGFVIPLRHYLDNNVVGRGAVHSYQLDPRGLITLNTVNSFYQNALTDFDLRLGDLDQLAASERQQPTLNTAIQDKSVWYQGDKVVVENLLVVLSTNQNTPLTTHPFSAIQSVVTTLSSADDAPTTEQLINVLATLGEDTSSLSNVPTPLASTFSARSSSPRSALSASAGSTREHQYYAAIPDGGAVTPFTKEVRYWHRTDPGTPAASRLLRPIYQMFRGYNIVPSDPFEIFRSGELIDWYKDRNVQTIFVEGRSMRGEERFLLGERWRFTGSTRIGSRERTFDRCVDQWNGYRAIYPGYVGGDNSALRFHSVHSRFGDPSYTECGVLIHLPSLATRVLDDTRRTHKKALLVVQTSNAEEVIGDPHNVFGTIFGASQNLFHHIAGSSGPGISVRPIHDLNQLNKLTTMLNQLATLLSPTISYLDNALRFSLRRDILPTEPPTEQHTLIVLAFLDALASGKLALMRLLHGGTGHLDLRPRILDISDTSDGFGIKLSSSVPSIPLDVHVYGEGGSPKPPSPDDIVVNIPAGCIPDRDQLVVDWDDLSNFEFDGQTYVQNLQIHGTTGQLGPQHTVCDEEDSHPSSAYNRLSQQNASFADALDASTPRISVYFPPQISSHSGLELNGNISSGSTLAAVPWISEYSDVQTEADPTCSDCVRYQCRRPDRRVSRPGPFRIQIPCASNPTVKSITSSRPTTDGRNQNDLQISLSSPVLAKTPIINELCPGDPIKTAPDRPVINIPAECVGTIPTTIEWGEAQFSISDEPYADEINIANLRHFRDQPDGFHTCEPLASGGAIPDDIEDAIEENRDFLDGHRSRPEVVFAMPQLPGALGTKLVAEVGIDNRIDHYSQYDPGDGTVCLAPSWQRAHLLGAQSGGPVEIRIPCRSTTAETGDGSRGNPGLSCNSILQAHPGRRRDTYWIDPDGNSSRCKGAPIEVHCDMDNDDGGWTIINFNFGNHPTKFDGGGEDGKFGGRLQPWGKYLHHGSSGTVWHADENGNNHRYLSLTSSGNVCKSTRDWLSLATPTTQFRLSPNCEQITSIDPGEELQDQVYRMRRKSSEEGGRGPLGFALEFTSFPKEVYKASPDETCDGENDAKPKWPFGRVIGVGGIKDCWAFR